MIRIGLYSGNMFIDEQDNYDDKEELTGCVSKEEWHKMHDLYFQLFPIFEFQIRVH